MHSRASSIVGSVEEQPQSRCGVGATSATSTAEGEIWTYGMSDDEVLASEEEEKEDEELSRNVVASAIHEGGGGGAFASPSTSRAGSFDAEKLGLVGLDSVEPEATMSRRSSLQEQPKLMSPLIAQLHLTPPSLDDLPPAALGPPAEAKRDATLNTEPTQLSASHDGCSSPSMQPPGRTERSDVQHLLVEMGGLVCQLQRRQELAITAQEARPDVMLERLEHFREVARGAGLRKGS